MPAKPAAGHGVSRHRIVIENGWKMIASVDIKPDWWFVDVILIESIWNPAGKKLYLTLLIDPMEVNKKEVWAVSVSTLLPENKNDSALGLITLNEVKKQDLKNFVKSINESILC
jgi:hypothetical protein